METGSNFFIPWLHNTKERILNPEATHLLNFTFEDTDETYSFPMSWVPIYQTGLPPWTLLMTIQHEPQCA